MGGGGRERQDLQEPYGVGKQGEGKQKSTPKRKTSFSNDPGGYGQKKPSREGKEVDVKTPKSWANEGVETGLY